MKVLIYFLISIFWSTKASTQKLYVSSKTERFIVHVVYCKPITSSVPDILSIVPTKYDALLSSVQATAAWRHIWTTIDDPKKLDTFLLKIGLNIIYSYEDFSGVLRFSKNKWVLQRMSNRRINRLMHRVPCRFYNPFTKPYSSKVFFMKKTILGVY